MRFRNYRNRHNKKNRIYSSEELLAMTLNDLLDDEPAILAQDKEIGIPDYEELRQSPNTRWIDKYTDEFGQQHGGYYGSISDYGESIAPKREYPWEDVYVGDLDEYIDRNIIEYMPKEKKQEIYNIYNGVYKGRIEKNDSLLDKLDNNISSKVDEFKTNIDDLKSNVENTKKKYERLTPASAAQKAASKLMTDNILENEYYKNALKMADGEPLTEKFLEENDVYSYKDITDPEKSKYYKEQLSKMYGLDMNDPDINEKLKDKKIVIPKESSRLYQYAKNSEEMQEWIVNNYDRIKNGEIPLENSIEFPAKDLLNDENRGLFATLHNINPSNVKINEDGSLSIDLDDNYDFEKWDRHKWNSNESIKNNILKKAIVSANNNAYHQQQVNQLENYPIKIQLNYTKEELEKLKRKRKLRNF